MPDARSPKTTAPAREGGTVVLGSRVRVRDADGGHEHTVVARVTVGAPTGMRLRGITGEQGSARAQVNDEVEVHTSGGVHLLTVVAVVTETVTPSPRSAAHARMRTKLARAIAAEERRRERDEKRVQRLRWGGTPVIGRAEAG